MDSASREKRKRMDNNAVRRSAPGAGPDGARAGQAGLPGGALQHMQLGAQQGSISYFCDTCKQFCAFQEHAEGPEMPPTMRCTACGSAAVHIDPGMVRPISTNTLHAEDLGHQRLRQKCLALRAKD